MIELGRVLAFARLRERAAVRLPPRPPLPGLEALAALLVLGRLPERLAA